jgi:nitrogen fixation protein NifQ
MFDERYAQLRSTQPRRRDEAEAFDDHVFACALALALAEQHSVGAPLTQGLGLASGEIAALIAERFPGMAAPLCLARAAEPDIADEEELLRDLLTRHACDASRTTRWLTAIIARRALRDDHLWQDLGLDNRGELNRLLARRYPRLHAGNTRNMRWKKYFYRQICELEGFTLCSAPHCSVCVDFAACFGDEDGLSRLAAAAREARPTLS